MLRIVLPVAAAPDTGAVVVAVDIRGTVDIDIHVSPAPVAVAEYCAGGREPDTPGKAANQCCPRVPHGDTWIVIGRISRVGPGAIDHRWIVGGHVDGLWLGRLNDDDLRLAAHDLLLVGLQIAGVLGEVAQALDRSHDVPLLAEKGVTELLCPVELLVHHFEDIGEGDQRHHADVPAFVPDLLDRFVPAEFRIGLGPPRCLYHLERIGRGHQNLRQETVGVEGDRCQNGIEFLRRERRWRRRRAGGCRIVLCADCRNQQHAGGQPPKHEGSDCFHDVLLGHQTKS